MYHSRTLTLTYKNCVVILGKICFLNYDIRVNYVENWVYNKQLHILLYGKRAVLMVEGSFNKTAFLSFALIIFSIASRIRTNLKVDLLR